MIFVTPILDYVKGFLPDWPEWYVLYPRTTVTIVLQLMVEVIPFDCVAYS